MAGYEQAALAARALDGLGGPAPNAALQRFLVGSVETLIAALSLRAYADGVRIELLGFEGERLLALGPFDVEEALAVGRSIEQESGLTLFGRTEDRDPFAPCGSPVAKLDRTGARRRLAVLSGRRPRFLVRRKPAQWPRRPLVHREIEMVEGCGV